MTQMARLLAVAFLGLWTLICIFYNQRRGVVRETKLPMSRKVSSNFSARGLICARGCNCGILQYYVLISALLKNDY